MLRHRVTSVLISTTLSSLLLMLFNPTLHGYRLPSSFLLCLNLGIYPLAGCIYAYRQRSSGDRHLTALLGGAIASAGVFVIYVLVSMAMAPSGIGGALSLAYQGLERYYPGGSAFAVAGSLMGLAIALSAVASLGGTSAMLTSIVLTEKRL